jgi:xanthosine utilization system XapX-like protein
VKTLAFVFGLFISAVGLVGILVPSRLLCIAASFLSSGAVGFYVIATVRIAFGLLLILVASASRAPRALRILGYVVVLLGITTALMGLLAVQQGGAAIDWWSHQSWCLAPHLGSSLSPRRFRRLRVRSHEARCITRA